MLKNILVPLDGSNLSEAALAPAALLAETLHAPVTLLHIIEQDAPREVHDDRHLTNPAEAEAYLKEIAGRKFKTRVKTHVHTAPVADVARSIVEHAQAEFNPDLIITCTHGRGGVHDLLFGSIAQQVVANGSTPLLLIKPASPRFKLDRVLVPLDPDSAHDDSFPFAQFIAKSFGARLILLSVIPTFSTLAGEQAAAGNLMPGTTQALLDIQEENAGEHLREHIASLKKDGVKSTALVARGDPAATILRVADEEQADLIILSTHRKAGMNAFWSRSVAPTVAQRTKIPLLLIPLVIGKEK